MSDDEQSGSGSSESDVRAPSKYVPRGKYWIGTYYPANIPFVGEPAPRLRRSEIQYARANPEIGNDRGVFHWQICVALKRRFHLKSLQEYLGVPSCTHFELAESPEAVRDYCSKEDTRADHLRPALQWGSFPLGPTRGRRTDLDRLCVTIRQGADEKEVAARHPSQYIRYHRGIERLISLQTEPYNKETKVIIIWGEKTGKGKSSWAADRHPATSVYWKDGGTQWWDGLSYSHSVCIVDEFGQHCTGANQYFNYRTVLRFTDRFPLSLRPRYSGAMFHKFECIYFISNLSPDGWFPNEPDISHFMRRVHKIYKFD